MPLPRLHGGAQLNLLERSAAEDEIEFQYEDGQALISDLRVDPLMEILLNLMDLDLTGSIVLEDTIMKRHGGYCDVFQGRTTDGMLVAVKRLRVYLQDDPKFTKRLAREVQIWSTLSHTNILPLMGYFLEGDRYPSLVTEWMANGTVAEYVRKHWNIDILSMVKGIVSGLRYLHTKDIAHADLKASNILMSASGIPLITDFGISILLSSSVSLGSASSGLKGSARWMAPEVLRAELDFKERRSPLQVLYHQQLADVWAFGMTVYELLTRGLPYADHRNDAQVICAIIQGELPSCLQYWERWPTEYKALWSYICCLCWETAETRFPVTDVANILLQIISGELKPPPVPPYPTSSRSQMPPLPGPSGQVTGRLTRSASTGSSSTGTGTGFWTSTSRFSVSSGTTGTKATLSSAYSAKDDRYIPHKFLAGGSPELVLFDVQLPLTSIRKMVKGQPTPLSLTDYREPATQPACAEFTIEVVGHPEIFIYAEPSRTDFVTVQDVLRAIHAALHQNPPAEQWVKSGLNPANVMPTFQQRSQKLLTLGLGQSEGSTYYPAYCDWLGPLFYFRGINYKFSKRKGKNKEAQWILDLSDTKIQ